jgi:transcriptional regulator with XRE-family HTH domain
MIDPHQISSDLARDRFTDAFRRQVGHDKPFTVSRLAELTGIDERTINAYRGGQATPNFCKLLRIGTVLGPAFVSELLAAIGMGGVEAIEEATVNATGIARDLVGEGHRILERMADGSFDHRDRAQTAPELRKLATALEAQANAMEGPALKAVK